MAKNKITNLLLMVLGVIVFIAIGGSFVSGLFLEVVILKYLPLIVHQIVGWAIIILAILSVVMAILKK